MTYGVTDRGFIPKPFTEILEELKLLAKEQFGDVDLTENSRLLRFLEIIAKREDELWQLAEDVYYSGFIDFATGDSLDHLASLIGFKRNPATKATGFVNFYRNSPAQEDITIPANTRVATASGVVFRTTTIAILERGKTIAEYVPIEAVNVGSVGNVAPGTITKLVDNISGIDGVTNPLATEGGRDLESDEKFRYRIKNTLMAKGKATINAIITAVRAVEGVKAVKIEENDSDEEVNGLPPHSFRIWVRGGDDDKIAQAIFDSKPAGIKAWGDIAVTAYDIDGNAYVVRFSRPTMVNIYVRVEIISSGVVDVQKLKDVVYNYINSLEIGQAVIVSKIIHLVLGVEGVEDCIVYVGTSYPPNSQQNIVIGETELASTTYDMIEIVLG